jgi:hypothetical protein
MESTALEVLANDDLPAAMKEEFDGIGRCAPLRTFSVLDDAYKKILLCSCPPTLIQFWLSKRKLFNLIRTKD